MTKLTLDGDKVLQEVFSLLKDKNFYPYTPERIRYSHAMALATYRASRYTLLACDLYEQHNYKSQEASITFVYLGYVFTLRLERNNAWSLALPLEIGFTPEFTAKIILPKSITQGYTNISDRLTSEGSEIIRRLAEDYLGSNRSAITPRYLGRNYIGTLAFFINRYITRFNHREL